MPKINIDYSKTIIYKIFCKDPTIKDVYVGHTTNFISRKSCHMNCCNHICRFNMNKLYKFIRNNGGWINWKMEIIEQVDCANKYEALQKEQKYFILLKATLNSVEPLRKLIQPHIQAQIHSYHLYKSEIIVDLPEIIVDLPEIIVDLPEIIVDLPPEIVIDYDLTENIENVIGKSNKIIFLQKLIKNQDIILANIWYTMENMNSKPTKNKPKKQSQFMFLEKILKNKNDIRMQALTDNLLIETTKLLEYRGLLMELSNNMLFS